ncbi:PRSS12 [Symbiodinium sp. CCMP2592]|nr:PRSS12 [Symbiodinium sp. CCMP2592]
MRPLFTGVCLVFAKVLNRAARANVRITAEGHPASSGLLEIQTSSGSYGSVCGMNAEAASVACRQLGFEFGVQSPSPCGQYGGGSWCGAAGSPVAVKSLKCLGTEMSVDECSSEAVDDACLSHGSDAVIFCGASSVGAFRDGELRLVGSTGAPALPKEAGRLEVFLAAAQAWAPVCKLGFTSGSASVACKQMGYPGAAGFAGCRSQEACGGVAPQLADLACSGSETSVLQCPMSTGDDVFCAPEESVLLSCAGQGDPIGKPTERTEATNIVRRSRTADDMLVLSVRHVSAATAAAPAHFLMISGVTAVDETCLAGSAAGVWLESCEKAVAGMSGEEIWSLATDGTLVHARSKTCLSPQGTSAAGVPLALVSCDAAGGVAKWELQGNGQVKMAQSNMCISQVGPSGAAVNAAASASVSASSTLDPSHGAALAVDGVASTYWVSKLDEADAVSLLLDFGEPVHGSVLELDFEFAPSAFSVQAAEASSENWLQLFATDSNALKHVKIPLAPAKPMSAVRLIMKEAHPTLGTMNGRKLVGVRSIRLLTRLLQPALEPCAVAAKSHDARDKFFTVAVSGFDPQAGAALAAEMPALESADAALSSIVVELAKALPAISSCKPGGPISLRANATIQSSQRRREVLDMALDVGQEAALLEEARGTIVAARGLLAMRPLFTGVCLVFAKVLNRAARANVRITAEGHPASSGLLEIQTSSGSYGSVCGMNAEAASVACRQLGFEFGVQSPSPCGQYGGGSWCGAAGSPVAVKSLKCLGTEMSVDECSSEAVDDACLSHGSDAVIFCGASSVGAFRDGELRLVGSTGAPALPKEAGRLEVFLAAAQAWAPVCKLGFTSGSASVACKQMGYPGAAGFAGCRSQEACGGVAPQLADLACSGSETSVLQCPMSTGDDVFCAPEESVLLSCAGQGDPIGKPTERTEATNIVRRSRTADDMLVLSVRHVSAATAAAPAHFLMISGVTAVDETCLAGSAAGVWLESCEKAVAGMSGEEIWSLATDGTLVHARSKTCLSPQGTSAAGVPLALVSCDAAGGVAKWELQGNGQVKMAQSNMCISQVGPSGAAVNAAASASVSASSTLDPSHGAALAVDGVASTYWVSKLDEADAVSLLLDFGEPVHGSVLELDFEFVPSAFSVQAAEASSENWLQLFATDSNALKHVKIPLAPAKPMSAVRLIMKEAHPTLGTMNGRKLVGVRSIRLLTRLLQPALEPCAVAAKSHDARDKFFTVAVSGFDPQAGAALAAEMPALESADAALSSIVVELAKALPAISSCKPGGPISLRANATIQSTQRRREVLDMALDVGQEAALLEEARGTIVAARGLLASS